ncbi:hypothetical protein [Nocardia farcinica]|uniref:hypothetical protein n=1 Tax=Nocardia farcinica TaxID=37329 RepID=UPI00343A359B
MPHDRTGELIEDPDTPKCIDPRCRNGWIGFDHEHRPIPCAQCKRELFEGGVLKTARINDYADRVPNIRKDQ